MRTIITRGPAVALAALLAGCQFVGYAGNQNFSNPFENDMIGSTTPPAPIVLSFPDDTMYFFPIFGDGKPRSDLSLLAFRCDASKDGRLVVTALVENEGPSIIASDWFRSAYLGSVKVAAMLTAASGGREQVDATLRAPLTIAKPTEMALSPAQTPPSEVVRIDVVADPDRVVPDPLRDDNALSWQGTMRAGAPLDCGVSR